MVVVLLVKVIKDHKVRQVTPTQVQRDLRVILIKVLRVPQVLRDQVVTKVQRHQQVQRVRRDKKVI